MKQIKIVFLSKLLRGGAGVAAQRLFHSIPRYKDHLVILKEFYSLQECHHINFYKLDYSNIPIPEKVFRKWRQFLYNKRNSNFLSERPENLESFLLIDHYHYLKVKADIIHLHWVSDFFNLPFLMKKLEKEAKVVISLHDESMYTGGCSYSLGCQKFMSGCKCCPQLGNPGKRDLSYLNYKLKKELFKDERIHFVANSSYIRDRAKKSGIIPNSKEISYIPFGFKSFDSFSKEDLEIFRKKYGLPRNKKIVLAGADHIHFQRKGFKFLTKAISSISPERDDFQLVLFGSGFTSLNNEVDYLSLDFLDQLELAKLYSLSYCLVFPSVQEAFGLICQEALGYGLPVVGFDNGGINELVENGYNGFISRDLSTQGLASSIRLILNLSKSEYLKFKEHARMKVKVSYSEEKMTRDYLKFYTELITS